MHGWMNDNFCFKVLFCSTFITFYNIICCHVMKDSHHHCQQYFKVWTCMQNETERAIDTDGKLNSESPGMMFASFTCKINDKVRESIRYIPE